MNSGPDSFMGPTFTAAIIIASDTSQRDQRRPTAVDLGVRSDSTSRGKKGSRTGIGLLVQGLDHTPGPNGECSIDLIRELLCQYNYKRCRTIIWVDYGSVMGAYLYFYSMTGKLQKMWASEKVEFYSTVQFLASKLRVTP